MPRRGEHPTIIIIMVGPKPHSSRSQIGGSCYC